MAINIYPLTLSPATLGQDYGMGPAGIVPSGGTAPYSFSITGGALPPGMQLATSSDGLYACISGQPLVADNYKYVDFKPQLQNPCNFTITATDSLAATGSVTYKLPVFVFSESDTISIYEMVSAVYPVDWYVVSDVMGSREIRIGDIGDPAMGGIRLVINAMLSQYTGGMIARMRQYVGDWDRIKLIAITQQSGSVDGISGVNMDWQKKRQLLLGLMKTIFPAFSLAEVKARQQFGGGQSFVGSPGAGSSGGHVELSR